MLYIGQYLTLTGKVVQAIQNGRSYVLRINVTPDDYDVWRDTVYVEYEARSPAEARILERDMVEFRGRFVGIKSYESTSKIPVQIPRLVACEVTIFDPHVIRVVRCPEEPAPRHSESPPEASVRQDLLAPTAAAVARSPDTPKGWSRGFGTIGVGVPIQSPKNTAVVPQSENGIGGSPFVQIQISSQLSEADAQSAFRALQARYSSLLQTRVPLIRRADTTEGIFYRTFVGPFLNWREANDYCEGFKKIGGQCAVAQFRDPRRPDIADEQNCQARKGYTSIVACTMRIASGQTGQLLVATYRYRGVAKIGERDYDGAIADFTQAIALDGSDSLAYSQRGQAHQLKGNYDRSLSDLNKALELDPSNVNALSQRAAVYSLIGEGDKAIADANAALAINPSAAVLKNNRAFAYNNIGEYDRAIVDLNDALQLDPSNVRAYKNRGISYEKKGDFRRALADYNAAINLDKNEVEAIDGARRVKERVGNTGKVSEPFNMSAALRSFSAFLVPLRAG
jgi:tetratricopeptide (TPR) repeat protein